MIYLLDGKETYYLTKKKQELLHQQDLSKDNIMRVDGSIKNESLMSDIYALCNTVSLFGEKRVVIVDEAYFFKTKTGTKASNKKETSSKKVKTISTAEILEKYCKEPNDDTDLIFFCFGYDADKRTKEFQILSSYVGKTVNHIHFGEPQGYEITSIVDRCLKENQISLNKAAKDELLLRMNGSITVFYHALDRLKLYGENKLNEVDIEHLVSSNLEINRWKLGNAFLSGNANSTFRAYEEMIEIDGMQVVGILPILASQIRGAYNSMVCKEEGMSENEIKIYAKRNYPMKDIQNANRFNSTDLLKILHDLAKLDQDIKSGKVQGKLEFENLLLRYL